MPSLTYKIAVCSPFRRYAWETRSTAATVVCRWYTLNTCGYRAAGERSARQKHLAKPDRGSLHCRRNRAIQTGPRRLVRYKLEPDRRLLRRQPGLRQLLGDAGSRPTRPNGRVNRRALHRANQDGSDGSRLDRRDSRSRRLVVLAAVPPAAAPYRSQLDVGSVSRGSDNGDDRSSARRDRRRPLAHLSRPHQAFPAHARILRQPGNAAPHRRGNRQVVNGDFAERRFWDESGCWNGCTGNSYEHQKKRSRANGEHPAALDRRVFASQVRNSEHDTGRNPAGRARTMAAPEPLAWGLGRRSKSDRAHRRPAKNARCGALGLL